MDKDQHLLCKCGQIQRGPGACAPARPRAAIHSSQGAGAPFIWKQGRGPDRLRRVPRAGGRGPAGRGDRVTERPPAWKTPQRGELDLSRGFSSPVFFLGRIFYHLSSCWPYFNAYIRIPRFRPYSPEERLKGPKWTTAPAAAQARWAPGGPPPSSPGVSRAGWGGDRWSSWGREPAPGPGAGLARRGGPTG